MLIYNTTFHVEDDINDQYLEYMRKKYIPLLLNSGLVMVSCFSRIHSQHQEKGISYSLQLKIKNMDMLDYWLEKEGKKYNADMIRLFGNKVAGFATVLEEIDF